MVVVTIRFYCYRAWGQTAAAITTAAAAVIPEPTINTGDTAWMIAATALVLLMTIPALALFYGGLVNRKNVLNTLMQCFIISCRSFTRMDSFWL